MIFKTAIELGFNNEEDFDDSEFDGVRVLMDGMILDRLRFACSEDGDEVEENFYFIESNANLITDQGNLVLYELEKIRILLIDFIDRFFIVIKVRDMEEINLMFD